VCVVVHVLRDVMVEDWGDPWAGEFGVVVFSLVDTYGHLFAVN